MNTKTLAEYLKELESKMGDKPQQVKDGMEIYLELWRKVIDNGVVNPGDEVDAALDKVEVAGGLYKAAKE